MMNRPALLLIAALSLLVTSACGPNTREEWRDDITRTTCERYEDCGRIGSGDDKFYNSFDDCIVKQRDAYNDLWPSDRCSDESIDEKKAEECIDRAKVRSCSTSTIERGFEDAGFFSQCSASKVCE